VAHERQYMRVGLVCYVKSFQGFIHSRNKHKQRDIAFFFFTERLIHVLFFNVTTKVTQKMAELCTEYPSLTIITWSE